MNRGEIYLEINDYLDLYLMAGKLGDKSWQQEVMGELQNYQGKEVLFQEPALTIHSLQEEYDMITEELAALNKILRNDPSNLELHREIWNIEQQRLSLSRQIHSEK